MLALLGRLDFVRDLGNHTARASRIHPARLARLVVEGGIMTAQHIAELEPARRTAILVTQAAHLEVRIADATLTMSDKYVGSLFTKARNREERRFQATRRDVARALLLFRRTVAAFKQAHETGEDGVAAVERAIGMKRLDNDNALPAGAAPNRLARARCCQVPPYDRDHPYSLDPDRLYSHAGRRLLPDAGADSGPAGAGGGARPADVLVA